MSTQREANTFALPRGSDNYLTPNDFYAVLDREFHFDRYDPCPINPDGLREYDGLTKETPGDVRAYFMNPPYSNPRPWLERSILDARRGVTVVVLLRGDTSTSWFHDLVLPYAEMRFVRGRIKFNGKPAPFASIVAIYRPFQSGAFKPQPVR